MYDLIIIGAGPAGLTASVYASRYRLKHIVIGKAIGGYLPEIKNIENYPGFKSISGVELTERLIKQVKNLDAEIREEEVIKAKKIKNWFEVLTNEKRKYRGKTILFASGTKRRKLNVPGEREFLGKGVSYCATCDAPFFKNKTVAVIGGSNSAAVSALHLSGFAKKIYVIYRRDKLRAEPYLVEKILKHPKIEIIYNTNVVEIKGKEYVDGVVLDRSHKKNRILSVDGVFIEIGFVPGTSIAKNLGVELNETGHIKINQDCSTNISGVYAAGDITNGSDNFRQIITAAAEGAIAARSVYFHINK